jgi:hypothetical protein
VIHGEKVVPARGSTELAEVRDRMRGCVFVQKPLTQPLSPLKIQRGEGTKDSLLAKDV